MASTSRAEPNNASDNAANLSPIASPCLAVEYAARANALIRMNSAALSPS